MELEINGKIYKFRFGVGFLKEINSRYKEMATLGVQLEVGFKYVVARMLDGYVDAIEDILLISNKTENPRITKKILEDYLDDESTDLNVLIDEIKSFLLQTNACKRLMNQILETLEEEQKEEEN